MVRRSSEYLGGCGEPVGGSRRRRPAAASRPPRPHDRGVERALVGRRWLAVAAHLAHVLERGGADLVVTCRYGAGPQGLDASAHAAKDTRCRGSLLDEQLLERVDDAIRGRDVGLGEHRHRDAGEARGLGGDDTGRRVLEGQRLRWIDAEAFARQQVDVRRRLGVLDVVGGDDRVERVGEAGGGERVVDQERGELDARPIRMSSSARRPLISSTAPGRASTWTRTRSCMRAMLSWTSSARRSNGQPRRSAK